MSSYDHVNISLNSISRVSNASFSKKVRVLPTCIILGSSSIPRLTGWVSSFIGSTCPCFNSLLLRVSLPISEIKKIQSQQISRNRNHIIMKRVLNRLNKLNRNRLYRNTMTNRLTCSSSSLVLASYGLYNACWQTSQYSSSFILQMKSPRSVVIALGSM